MDGINKSIFKSNAGKTTRRILCEELKDGSKVKLKNGIDNAVKQEVLDDKLRTAGAADICIQPGLVVSDTAVNGVACLNGNDGIEDTVKVSPEGICRNSAVACCAVIIIKTEGKVK